MKRFLLTILSAAALAACSSDDNIGNTPDGTDSQGNKAITFGGQSEALTRATTGATAAGTLGGSFHLFGVKTMSDDSKQVVFGQTSKLTDPIPSDADTYRFWYKTSTAGTTTTNSAGWEYVGEAGSYTPNWGTAGTAVTLASDQTIKYWDYSASSYDFLAYSVDDGGYIATPWETENHTYLYTGVVSNTVTYNGFWFQGVPQRLQHLYVADHRKIAKANYGQQVALTFRNAAAKVRVGFYETVPGYYVSALNNSYIDDVAHAGKVVVKGKFIGSRNTEVQAKIAFTDADGSKATFSYKDEYKTTSYDFGKLKAFGSTQSVGASASNPRYLEEEGYNVTSEVATDNYYTAVWPNTTVGNYGDMLMKITYTLHADDTNETMTKTATCAVPAAFMAWQSGYAYTYLFKITDSNLTPITFDGLVVVDGDGEQYTVTSFGTHSITTYSEGVDVTTAKEYKVNDEIFAVVNGVTQAVGTTAGQTQVYSIGTTAFTEEQVATVLGGGSVTGLSLATTVLTDNATNVTTTVDGIGTLTGHNAVKFTPTAAGYYAYVYREPDGTTYSIKIIHVTD